MSSLMAPTDRLTKSSPQNVREVDVVTTAYRSVLSQAFTYVSTPITSGARLYEALRRTGLSLEEFMGNRKLLVEEVIVPNVEEATAISHGMLSTTPGAIISPAIFEAKACGWGQDEYMALWLRIINEKVTRVVMLDGWEYSNGAVEEYVESVLMRYGYRQRTDIEAVDTTGRIIPVDEAFARIVEAAYNDVQHHATPRVHAEAMLRLSKVAHEHDIKLDRRAEVLQSNFLQFCTEWFDETDPAFLRNSITSALWQMRQQKPADAHLTRKREALPEDVTLKGFEVDEDSEA